MLELMQIEGKFDAKTEPIYCKEKLGWNFQT